MIAQKMIGIGQWTIGNEFKMTCLHLQLGSWRRNDMVVHTIIAIGVRPCCFATIVCTIQVLREQRNRIF